MIVFFVTFSLFFIEAMLHYNIGTPKQHLHLPERNELTKIVIVLTIFSALNSYIIKKLSKFHVK
jgi:tetrahydromethanopterin S-methyltransferase subunit D